MSWKIKILSSMSLLFAALFVSSPLAVLAVTDGTTGEWKETNFTEPKRFLFILGTDFNEVALREAAMDPSISSELNVSILSVDDGLPEEIIFSEYSVVFIESQEEALAEGWSWKINDSNLMGTKFLGYRLSPNVTAQDFDLSSPYGTGIERYWVQGGEANMANMLRLMGREFLGLWAGVVVPEPEIVQPKTRILFIMNLDSTEYAIKSVWYKTPLLQDLFDVRFLDGEVAAASEDDFSEYDVIYVAHLGGTTMNDLEERLRDAASAGVRIPTFMKMVDVWSISNVNVFDPVYSPISGYFNNDVPSETNMINWILWTGAAFNDVYVEYGPPQEVDTPTKGIYRPETYQTYPMKVFENSTEYFEWYRNRTGGHVYDPSNLTVGVIGWEDAAIAALESRGINVIAVHSNFIEDDAHYLTDEEGNVLVDLILSFKGFYLYYGDPEAGKERIEAFNVPVIKVVTDYYFAPEEWENGTFGLSPQSVPFQIVQPEIDGAIEYIWVSGRAEDPITGEMRYRPVDYQMEWLCDRAAAWGRLKNLNNSEKRVAIIYYNHGGGKNNIGASYLDISASLPLLLSKMKDDGYYLGEEDLPTTGKEIIDLFVASRNVGTWAPGELKEVVDSGHVELLAVDEYLEWYNGTNGEVPEEVRAEIEEWWGAPPGDGGMVCDGAFVIPLIRFGNVVLAPQPMVGSMMTEEALYHNTSVPIGHQYFAFYLWLDKKFEADAIVHFGTHGTQEWRPGKQAGLSRRDYPPLLVQDMPVVYPYIMDNVGEGTQAKRRGNAVIIDHLTPPIVSSGLYDEFLAIADKMESYESATDPALKLSYRRSIIEVYDSLGLELDLQVNATILSDMGEAEFDDFLDRDLHDYLLELRDETVPYGLHVFGVAPNGTSKVEMIRSMLGDSYLADVEKVAGDGSRSSTKSSGRADDLLFEVLIKGTDIIEAQNSVLGGSSDEISSYLRLAVDYGERLDQSTREMDNALRALSGEFIRSEPGGDPIRRPDALPTGNNFYSFDPRMIPDEEAEHMGIELAESFLDMYREEHGDYPEKVGFVLWSVETMRHRGIFEAQIYGLLGVRPVRSMGRIVDFEVTPLEELGRPRIDVVLTPSGLYRDTFGNHIDLFDQAIRRVAELDEPPEMNRVRARSEAIKELLLAEGYDNETSHLLSRSRIFIDAPGTYGGGGIAGVVEASSTWENESKVADRYISGQGYVYGGGLWGEPNEVLFRFNLETVDAAVQSDSSNLYGLMDNDDMFQYFGAMALAVRSLKGETPEMYITSLKRADAPEMKSLEEAYRMELRSRYFNPKWIEGMMEHDYAGAREMDRFVEHLWGWDVTLPDMVCEDDWNRVYDVYVADKYDLGIEEFFDENNPYARQSMTARMLEAARKEYWDPSEDVKMELAEEFAESEAEYGVACCHHTCGNLLLREYMEGILTGTEPMVSPTVTAGRGGSSRHPYPPEWSTSSAANETRPGGIGSDYSRDPEAATEPTEPGTVAVTGMVMESLPEEGRAPSISGAPLMGIVLVLFILLAIGAGFRRR
jgi:cobaltochelatase CobN